jgi:lipid-binding SYLF domain-containing protein
MKKQTRNLIIMMVMMGLCLGMLACSTTLKSKSEKNAARDEVRAMTEKTLSQLYQKEPAAKGAVAGAAGYAVFSDFGFKILIMGGAGGSGMAVNNATKQETFMKMAEFQPGLGLGAQKYRLVFIFENPDAFNNFVTSGWELGANAMAAAKDEQGEGGGAAGAVTVSDGVKMYQLSDTGAIVGVSITAAKYYKDDELN